MKKVAILLVAGLVAGFAVARLLPTPADDDSMPGQSATPAVAWFDADKPADERLAELERAVGEEREARQLLEEELLYLRAELDELRGGRPLAPGSGPATAVNTDMGPARFRGGRRGETRESRIERLREAGLPPERAAWIVQRESEIQYEMLKARHDAERSGDFSSYRERFVSRQHQLREELGESDYERYLQGTGRPTSVAVSAVMDASPAQSAGLQPGDEIVRYAGERIYDVRDLNRITLEGRAGETVYIEILRDGIPMQVAVPRGPVGVMSNGRMRQ